MKKYIAAFLLSLFPAVVFGAALTSYPEHGTPSTTGDGIVTIDNSTLAKAAKILFPNDRGKFLAGDGTWPDAVNIEVDGTTIEQSGTSPNFTIGVKPGVFALAGSGSAPTEVETLPGTLTPGTSYVATDTGDLTIASDTGYYTIPGTRTVYAVPLAAPTAVISGAGPQILTFTYAEAATAATTADLCDDWSITMTTAGALTLGYVSGDATTGVVCSISQDVFDDDTVASASYTPGTIEAVDDGGNMAAIADFASGVTNSSSESGGSAAVYVLDFEENSLVDFSSTTDADGDMTVTAGSALNSTSYGLNLLIDDTNAAVGSKTLTSSLFSSTGKFKISGHIDPNSLTMANNDTFRLFAIELSAAPTNHIMVSLLYTTTNGYALKFSVYNDTTLLTEYTSIISDAPHIFSLEETRASSNVASDGLVVLKIDGSTVNTWSSVDNFDIMAIVRTIKSGIITGVDAGTSGAFFMDEINVYDNF